MVSVNCPASVMRQKVGRPSPPCGAKRSVVFVSSGSMSSMK